MNWARRTLALGLPVEDEPLRLLCAMTLGWPSPPMADPQGILLEFLLK